MTTYLPPSQTCQTCGDSEEVRPDGRGFPPDIAKRRLAKRCASKGHRCAPRLPSRTGAYRTKGTTMTAPLIFLDTETLGLGLDDPIWEIGLIRREPDGTETEHHFFVADEDGLPCLSPANFPEPFASDFQARYHDSGADLTDRADLAVLLRYLLRPVDGVKPHIVGAVPNFDTERIERQFGVTGWHYHLIDVEALIVGYTYGKGWARFQPPWYSDDLSLTIGIKPEKYARHTALGDARWARDIYDAIRE